MRISITFMCAQNSWTLYRYVHSSFGWDPSSKRLELFDPASRFILVRSADTDELVAYSMFRFDDEDDEDVIYWSVSTGS